MAEGWAKSLLGEQLNAYSAGTLPQKLNQLAVKAMSDSDVDISQHFSKSMESLSDIHFDLVVTVCDNAASSCPTPPAGTRVIHAPFDDPPKLAEQARDETEALQHYYRVRDEIKDFIIKIPGILKG